MWTWSNFLHERAPAGRRPVHVNMDETAIRFCQETRQGLLSARARQQRRSARSLWRQVPRGTTRAMMSLLAFVCDDEAIQALLPQVVLVSAKVSPLAELPALRAPLRSGVLVWREPRAWTTASIMVRLLGLLHRSLRSVLASRQIILSMDAYKAHICRAVWQRASRLGIFLFVIPAKMTWALQPCDTHVFSVLKRALAERCQASSAAEPRGDLPRPLLMEALSWTITNILRGRDWSKAFRDNGLCGGQGQVSLRLVERLGGLPEPAAGSHLPSLAMLQDIFPRGTLIPIEAVFRAVVVAASPREPPPGSTRAPLAFPGPPADAFAWRMGRPSSQQRRAERPQPERGPGFPAMSSPRGEPGEPSAPGSADEGGTARGAGDGEAAGEAPAAESPGASAAGGAAATTAASAVGASALLSEIQRLKEEQKSLRDGRRRVAKELRNAEKRRQRLRKKARLLSDADLVQVIGMRQAAAEAQPKSSRGVPAPSSATTTSSTSTVVSPS